MVVAHYGDDGRTGVYGVSGLPEAPNASRLARTAAPVLCPPVLAGDALVVADIAGTVYTFDASTGETRWRVPGENAELWVQDENGEWPDVLTMAVAVWRDRVFVAETEDGTFEYYADLSRKVRIHDLATGELTGTVPGGGYPAVVGDTLLLYGLNSGIRVFGLPDLAPLWHAAGATGRVQTVPAVGPDGSVHVPGGFEIEHVHGGVMRLDPLTGQVTDLDGNPDVDPDEMDDDFDDLDGEYEARDVTRAVHAVVAEGLVWMPVDRGPHPYEGAITGQDPRTGEIRWSHRMLETPAGAVAVADGTVFAAVNRRGGGGRGEPSFAKALTAIDIAGRAVRWTRPLPGTGAGSPVLADGVVYMAVREGRVLALDAASGDVRWEFDLGEPILDKEETGYFDEECAYEEDAQVIVPGDGVLYVRTAAGVMSLR
ncbi:outer membrane protein assembly factor BamB family protein [Actinomadura napierensis]|uniref:Pyrrolo-quinoline quinone repeat domain-containing protein n=1 Tax=Actinomadura napierensis TaxID=267854 RepID=A0ABP5M3T3_9ACTN